VRKAPRAPRRRQLRLEWPTGPSSAYLAAWIALTPAERLRRAWALRDRLRNPQAVHDAKTFRSFERFGLDYLLISGQAAILYGAATFSEDVDIWIQPTPENATRLLRALAACQQARRRAHDVRTPWGRIPVVAIPDLIALKRTRRLSDYAGSRSPMSGRQL
jgi:hypothetical protein